MHQYAQTNIQLFNQVQDLGYSPDDCLLVARAYRLAMELFAGLYRASGKTFIAHVVGTASILAAERAEAPVISAGLVHAAYLVRRRDGWLATRARVLNAVGTDVERNVSRYGALRWTAESIPDVALKIEGMDAQGRRTLLLRLANELDEYLDGGASYSGDGKRAALLRHGVDRSLVAMARCLGALGLARSFEDVFARIAKTAPPPPELRFHHDRAFALGESPD